MSPARSISRSAGVVASSGCFVLCLLYTCCALQPVDAYDYIVEPGPEIIATKGACVCVRLEQPPVVEYHFVVHLYLCPLPWIRRHLAETGAPEQYGPIFGIATALVSIQCKPVWKCCICCRFVRIGARYLHRCSKLDRRVTWNVTFGGKVTCSNTRGTFYTYFLRTSPMSTSIQHIKSYTVVCR